MNKKMLAAILGTFTFGAMAAPAFAQDTGGDKAPKEAKEKKGKKGKKGDEKKEGGEKSCGADGKSCSAKK